jgi:hypothetical protein
MVAIRNLAAAFVLLIAFNDTAFACAACFGASAPGTLRAYYISTVLLSTMPFVLVAGFVILLRRYRLGGVHPLDGNRSKQ